MNKYLTEFIGTFFLVLTIGLSAGQGQPLAPVAIGFMLTVMIYMGGHISGAHYNPAVTLAIFLLGRNLMPRSDLIPYWVAQILGGLAAAFVSYVITGSTTPIGPGADFGVVGQLLIEILFTFALALVVLNVATHKKVAGNFFYGTAIGFMIVAAAIAGGSISGGAYNPAVGTGLAVVDSIFRDASVPMADDVVRVSSITNIWLYLIGPLAGGALAPFVFRVQDPD